MSSKTVLEMADNTSQEGREGELRALREEIAETRRAITELSRALRRQTEKWVFRRGIPTLTRAAQDGYEVYSPSEYDVNHAARFAFDDNVHTRWATVANSGDGRLQIKLPKPCVFDAVKIGARGDACLDQSPRDFQVQGSNDNINWTPLGSEMNVHWKFLGEFKTFRFNNTVPYLYYRLYITSNQHSPHHAVGCFILGNAVPIN